MINYDFSKLKGKIKEIFKTQNNFAIAMDMAPNTLSSKLNNLTEFSSSEISKAIELLNITSASEAWDIFFTQFVEKKSTNEV